MTDRNGGLSRVSGAYSAAFWRPGTHQVLTGIVLAVRFGGLCIAGAGHRARIVGAADRIAPNTAGTAPAFRRDHPLRSASGSTESVPTPEMPEDVRREWAAMEHAEDALSTAVDKMRHRLRLAKDTATIVAEIKQTMHMELPSRGLTVFQALYTRDRQGAFNREASDEFPALHREFDAATREFMTSWDGSAPPRKARRLARNAWKEDAAADRRAREMERRVQGQPQGRLGSPFRDRPEVYDRDVVIAFVDVIARAAKRPKVSWTRRVDNNKSEGEMLDVVVAAVECAMCSARLAAGAEPARAGQGRGPFEGYQGCTP